MNDKEAGTFIGKSRVILLREDDYNEEKILEKLRCAAQLLGGVGKYFSKEEHILIKPNLLAKATPEKACTTHPAVFSAAVRLLRESGCDDLFYGDSSGGRSNVEPVARASGIEAAANALGVPMGNFSEGETTPCPDGRVADSFVICRGVLEADAILDVCKMKTHMLERVTGANKNLFGAVYGLNKGAAHVKYPNADEFAKMMGDLNRLLRSRLHIMDGIVAMEGNGPQSGTPVRMGTLLVSADPIALDSVFCALVYLDPALVPTNVRGEEAGLGTYRWENIEVVTEDGAVHTVEEMQAAYGKPDFDVYRAKTDKKNITYLRPVQKLIEKKLTVDADRCIGCGICEKSCPVDGGAVHLTEKKGKKIPVYDHKKCIRCYCCQEMCPQAAISVKIPPLAKALDREWNIGI